MLSYVMLARRRMYFVTFFNMTLHKCETCLLLCHVFRKAQSAPARMRQERASALARLFVSLLAFYTRPHSLAASAQRFSLFACAPSSRLARACKWLSTIAQLYSFSPSLPLAVDGWSSSD